jgi:hypothetical protein
VKSGDFLGPPSAWPKERNEVAKNRGQKQRPPQFSKKSVPQLFSPPLDGKKGSFFCLMIHSAVRGNGQGRRAGKSFFRAPVVQCVNGKRPAGGVFSHPFLHCAVFPLGLGTLHWRGLGLELEGGGGGGGCCSGGDVCCSCSYSYSYSRSLQTVPS